MSDTPTPADLEQARLLLWTMTFGQPVARAAVDLLFTLSRHGAEALETLDRARAVMIRATDALEADEEVSARREAFEMIQEQFEGVSDADYERAEALIPTLRAALAPTQEGR